jgi:dCMP deaminase
VIVDDRQVLLSVGWNGFPRGVCDAEHRHVRPEKYLFFEHAERNAIYNAAAKGISLLGSTMYLRWYPCAKCASAIIQSGIARLICVEPDWNDPNYKDEFHAARLMFGEAGTDVRFVEGIDPPVPK